MEVPADLDAAKEALIQVLPTGSIVTMEPLVMRRRRVTDIGAQVGRDSPASDEDTQMTPLEIAIRQSQSNDPVANPPSPENADSPPFDVDPKESGEERMGEDEDPGTPTMTPAQTQPARGAVYTFADGDSLPAA